MNASLRKTDGLAETKVCCPLCAVGITIKDMRLFFISLLIPFAICHLPFAHTYAQSPEQERLRLEQELAQLEKQIDGYEETISTYQKQGKNLKGEIGKLNNQISKINLQIKAVNLEITKLDLEIGKNKNQIVVTQKNLDFNKKALAAALRSLYEKDRANLTQLLLQNASLSGFFSNVHGLIAVQDDLRQVIHKVNALREQLLDQQEELALRKSDQRSLAVARDAQKKSLEGVKVEKSDLLTITKGEEGKFQQLLQVTKQTAAQIRSKIFQFLGGGELNFGEAYQLAKIAQEAVGVRAAFILAVLDKESALGQNVGRCRYQEAMHPRRDVPIFLQLLAELNINPASVTVSCANRDGAYGGAMGPAQFIPSTWTLYKERIAGITGNRPPSPWRNADAFVATALYLKDQGANLDNNADIIRRAAAKYYAGSRWRRHLGTYGERVMAKMRQFEEDIMLLNS